MPLEPPQATHALLPHAPGTPAWITPHTQTYTHARHHSKDSSRREKDTNREKEDTDTEKRSSLKKSKYENKGEKLELSEEEKNTETNGKRGSFN